MRGKNIIRGIFIVSLITVIVLGSIVYMKFHTVEHRLIVHFDVDQGITTGAISTFFEVIGFVFFLEILNILVFRIVYIRSRQLSYLLPVLNGVLSLLLLAYILVIISLN